MLNTISQVNEQVFKILVDATKTVVLPPDVASGIVPTVSVRYAKKSGKDFVQETDQAYPCIAIQDYTPNPKDDWFVDQHKYVEGFAEDGLTAHLFQNPLHLEFRYDVSIAAKSYKEFMALKNMMFKKFLTKDSLLLNQKLTGHDAVGDVATYTLRTTDMPRTDGVQETNFEFTLAAWVHLTDPEEVTLIQNVILNLQNVAV